MSVTEPIFHLAYASDWAAAIEAGEYRVSTRGATIDDVGFIHASLADQVERVAAAFYGDETAELVVLEIDPAGLPVTLEPGDPVDPASEIFPHIYGPLPTRCVRRATPARMVDGGLVVEPADPS